MARKRIFEAIMGLLADRQWHDVGELRAVTGYPDEWVRELLLEGRVEVSTERETLAPLVRLRVTGAAAVPAGT